jgi:uncharacterized protein
LSVFCPFLNVCTSLFKNYTLTTDTACKAHTLFAKTGNPPMPKAPLAGLPPYIRLDDIEAQPALLRGLCERIPLLPQLQHGVDAFLFVAEGECYYAVAWQIHLLQLKLPHIHLQLMHVWEMENMLNAAELLGIQQEAPPCLIALVNAATNAPLQKIAKRFYTLHSNAPKGYFIGGAEQALHTELAPHMGELSLNTETTVGTLNVNTYAPLSYLVHALFFPSDILTQLDIIAIGLATLLQTLPFHPEWGHVCQAMQENIQRPMVLVACTELMPLMPEVQRLLSAGLQVPVSYVHVEDPAHAWSYLAAHPTEQSQAALPQHLYFPPESPEARKQFDAHVASCWKSLPESSIKEVRHIWLNANSEAPVQLPNLMALASVAGQPDTPATTLAEHQVVMMSMHSFMPANLMALAMIQRLVRDVAMVLFPGQGDAAPAQPEEAIIIGDDMVRTGHCTQCGACCQNLYLEIGQKTIMTLQEFQDVQQKHPDQYGCFEPTGVTDVGVVFKCVNLGEDNLCQDYEHRPQLCHTYPSEDSVRGGRKLPKDCGFVFSPLSEFNTIMQERAAQGQKLSEFAVGFTVEHQSGTKAGQGKMVQSEQPKPE